MEVAAGRAAPFYERYKDRDQTMHNDKHSFNDDGAPRTAPRAGAPVGRGGGTVGFLQTRRNRVLAGAAVLAVLVLVGVGVWWFTSSQDDFYDGNSILGQAPYKTPEEVQAELDRIVEEGMLNISIASVIEFDDGTAPGTAYIENVPGNHYAMKVRIVLDDTGNVVYESGGLKPGTYIETITLSQDLELGSYPATATFAAYNMDTLEEVGQAGANINLEVLG